MSRVNRGVGVDRSISRLRLRRDAPKSFTRTHRRAETASRRRRPGATSGGRGGGAAPKFLRRPRAFVESDPPRSTRFLARSKKKRQNMSFAFLSQGRERELLIILHHFLTRQNIRRLGDRNTN